MTSGLSILIPCYNYICKPLAEQLARQAASVAGLRFELVVIDDGSTERAMVEVNRSISRMAHCRHILLAVNLGRAGVRNRLAREARYDCLLFVDCRHTLPDARFVSRYVEFFSHDVVVGGIRIEGDRRLLRGNLRFLYEKSAEAAHTAARRGCGEYRDFHTANFMVRRSVTERCRFDERIRRYGYEDVLFGRRLCEAGIRVTHIDNPVGFSHFESNRSFVAKTEEGLVTLREFSAQLQGYSTLLHIYNKVGRLRMLWVLRLGYRLFGGAMRRSLTGRRPRLVVFKLYKLAYFASLPES